MACAIKSLLIGHELLERTVRENWEASIEDRLNSYVRRISLLEAAENLIKTC